MNFTFKLFGQFSFKKEHLSKFLADYFSVRSHKIYWLAAAIANLLLWALAFLIKRGLHQDLAILHYSITFGIDYLAPRVQVYALPLLALLLFLANGLMSLHFFKQDAFLANILLAAALTVNILVGLGLYAIYLVNFVKLF